MSRPRSRNLLLPPDPAFMIGKIEIKPDAVIVNMYVTEGQSLRTTLSSSCSAPLLGE